MGEIKDFKNEKLVIGVLTSRPDTSDALLAVLEGEFGPADYKSRVLDFTYSSYYDREMGGGIKRYFLSFRQTVPPDTLADIKHTTNRIEMDFAEMGERKTNLDPGLLNLSRLILASTKDNVHRVPLSRGIYAEVTLVYIRKAFQNLLWTYPDYASDEYKSILTEIREIYREQLKQNHSK